MIRLRKLGLLASTFLAIGLGSCDRAPAPTGLVLVTIDTCRADRIGAFGARTGATPHLDALADAGTRFLQTQAPVPLTAPSHTTIMTGLYPDRHGVRDNGTARLSDEGLTLAEILKERGWRTAAFVSAFPVTREFGLDQGFDHYDDALVESSAGVAGAENAEAVAERMFYDERIASSTTDAALEWLREASRGSESFFTWIHYFDPHAMYRPPARFMRVGMEPYDGEIAFVDEQIGRILEALGDARSGVTVVVTADHGESLGEHGESTHGLFTYESTLRVPWILAGPAVPIGERVEDPVSLVDVMPTALDALGLADGIPGDLDGESCLPLALGRGEGPAFVHGECLFPRYHFDWAGLRTIRRGPWKLIEAPRAELYDLSKDPAESTNLVDEQPEVVSELRAEMRSFEARGGAIGADEVALDEAARERLERLGYVGAVGGDAQDDLWNLGGRDPKDMVEFFNRLQELPTILMSGRYDEGERMLLDLRQQDPKNSNVVEKLALLERLRENWSEAARWCEEQIRLQPAELKPRMNLAWARRQLGDVAAARAMYEEVLEIDPEHAEAWRRLGSLESEAGDADAAVTALESAARLSPDDPETLAALGQAREDAGDTAGALGAYDRALALDANLPAAVNGKALALSHAGRASEAVAVLRAALPALAEDADLRNNLAWILANENLDAKDALVHARKALELAPDDPATLDTFGWAAIRAGEPAEAIAPLRRALESTGDAEVRAHLGIALAQSGQEREGREMVRQALAERESLGRIPEVARWR
ncbi:MAG: sulfatase-like hydrolase/transferase [Gemmatimonadetes bacterium]|nr:sulfatase-like hydrolase/transferase [Gemmatimonadota bacterium]